MTTIDDRQKVFGFVLPVGSDGELIKQTILTYLGVGLMIIVFIVFLLPRLSELVTSSSAVDELHKKEVLIKKEILLKHSRRLLNIIAVTLE